MDLTADQLRQQRRERREARRAKQRVENVDRARDMHRARLAADPVERSEHALRRRAYVGCSGWYYWHWGQCFYPPTQPKNRWFDYYASAFGTVELNAPFYSWPKLATVRTWQRQLGRRRGFVYTVKVNELITHVKRFVGTKRLISDFCWIADVLGPVMGCFLFQLPPSVHFSRTMLDRITSQLDPSRRNVVEFRHRSWWNPQVYREFEKKGIVFCSSSSPRLPDELIQTADEVYLRFNGVKQWYRHDYSKQELAEWVKRIERANPHRVWAYFNNDRNCNAIRNARELVRQLKNLERNKKGVAIEDDHAL